MVLLGPGWITQSQVLDRARANRTANPEAGASLGLGDRDGAPGFANAIARWRIARTTARPDRRGPCPSGHGFADSQEIRDESRAVLLGLPREFRTAGQWAASGDGRRRAGLRVTRWQVLDPPRSHERLEAVVGDSGY